MTQARKPLLRFVTTVTVLAALAVGGDRATAWTVERSLESALSMSATAPAGAGGVSSSITGADIQLHGFPFLTQVISGRLSNITGSIAQGRFGQFEVRDLHFSAFGVSPQEPFHVESATANALFPYETISAILATQSSTAGMHIEIEGYGTTALKLTGSILGIELGLVAQPQVIPPNTVSISVAEILIGGLEVAPDALPFGLGNNISDFEFNIELPPGTALTSISIEPTGLRVYVSATDVALTELFPQQ
ncbi:MAG: DUF2993 domain-containing protein [Cellulomonadaceae bacterium]|jgi:hypothetical protein|nr:DUF2993 domain-containing protein [Cellulomonadaceae bacterium]